MCQTVKSLVDSINRCCYRRNENNEGSEVYVCNLCGCTFLSFQDVIDHVLTDHIHDTIPDIDPTA